MKRLHRPMMQVGKGWCEIEIHERDMHPFLVAHHENKPIALPHGNFLPESYFVCRAGRVGVYCRQVHNHVWEYQP